MCVGRFNGPRISLCINSNTLIAQVVGPFGNILCCFPLTQDSPNDKSFSLHLFIPFPTILIFFNLFLLYVLNVNVIG